MVTKQLQLAFSLLMLLCIHSKHAQASHLIGGNMSYEFVSVNNANQTVRYKIKITAYNDCNSNFWGSGFPETNLNIGVYRGTALATGNLPYLLEFNASLIDSARVVPYVPPNCPIGMQTCIYILEYQGIVNLPFNTDGYHLIYDRCCRPPGIVNLQNSGAQATTLHCFIPPSSGPNAVFNNSASFTDTLVTYICSNDTTPLINTAFDADGDVLQYSLVHPYRGYTGNGNGGNNPPVMAYSNMIMNPYGFEPPLVIFNNGYNLLNIFGVGGYTFINPNTGYSELSASAPGIYVFAVEIREFRNGVLIGRTRRDMQVLAQNCPLNDRPIASPTITHPKATGNNQFRLIEGDSICFDVNYTDANSNNIDLVLYGEALTPALVNPGIAGPRRVNAQGSVTSRLCWQTACGQGRTQPYTFTARATDDGCPPKITYTFFSIIVDPSPGVGQLSGPTRVCAANANNVLYTLPYDSGNSVQWQVVGGTILSQTDSNMLVNWNVGQNAMVIVSTTNKFGCVFGPDTLEVVIGPTLNANIGPDLQVCRNDQLVLGIGNAVNGVQYNWSSGFISGANQYPLNLTASQSGQIILTVSDSLNCTARDTMNLTVFPLPNVSANSTGFMCDYDSIQLQASGAVTYRWEPTAFLNDAFISNPKAQPPKSTLFWVEGTDVNGCKDSAIHQVIVQSFPQFQLQYDTSIFFGQLWNAMLTSPENLKLEWKPDDINLCKTCDFQSIRFNDNQEIHLRITDSYGCYVFDTLFTIEVISDYGIYIPNTFTPDRDNLNEGFMPVLFGIEKLKEFVVYDRWGTEVFKTNQKHHAWNGDFKGKRVQANSVFVYKVVVEKYTGEEIEFIGKVLVLY